MERTGEAAAAAPRAGHITGELAAGEDRARLEEALLGARELVLSGRAEILLHLDHCAGVSASQRRAGAQKRLELLRRGKLKRYVFGIETAAGPRIVKIAEPASLGNKLVGLMQSSIARREHDNHMRAEALDLAATRTCGFLEWRHGPLLARACQIQTLLEPGAVTLDALLSAELERFGDAALDPLADALAEAHGKRFFHADLKGFHAFPTGLRRTGDDAPASYRLRWLDLGRVSFWLSRRKRVINLYQMFRFVLPERLEAQERFIERYCRATGWYASRPRRALRVVRGFLEHKLRTHPDALG